MHFYAFTMLIKVVMRKVSQRCCCWLFNYRLRNYFNTSDWQVEVERDRKVACSQLGQQCINNCSSYSNPDKRLSQHCSVPPLGNQGWAHLWAARSQWSVLNHYSILPLGCSLLPGVSDCSRFTVCVVMERDPDPYSCLCVLHRKDRDPHMWKG